MTNKEATNAARRIVFTPAWPEVYPDVAKVLTLIVSRQVARLGNKGAKRWLQANNGQSPMAKAPGHDAAVKAAKARKGDTYSVLDATDGPSWATFEQDRRRRG